MNYKDHKEGDLTVRTYDDGHKEWYLNGQLHRTDGPAMVYDDGSKEWWLNGQLHREDGPAVENEDGTKRWFLDGKIVYCDYENYLKDYPDVSEQFKKSIILYELQRN